MMRPRPRTCALGALLLIGLGGLAQRAQAQQTPPRFEPRGRFSLRDYILFDNDDAHDTHLLTGDVDVFLPRIGGSKLSLLFDGEFRKDLSSHEAASAQEELYAQPDPATSTDDKVEYIGRSERGIGTIRSGTVGDYIRSAYLEYAGIGDLLTVRAGRMFLSGMGQAWVDGLQLEAQTALGLGGGAYGGLSPDPLTYGFATDHQAFGAFAGFTTRSLLLQLSVNEQRVGGETDRRFLFSSGHLGLGDQLFLSYSATVDLAGQKVIFPGGDWQGEQPQTEDLPPQLTLGFANLLWWLTPQLSLNLAGSTYRNVPFRVSRPYYWPTDLDRDILAKMLKLNQADRVDLPSYVQRLYLGDSTAFPAYYTLRASPSLRFGEGYYVYVSVDWRNRELDGETAYFVSGGLRNDDWWGSGLDGRVEYTVRDGYLSGSREVFAALERRFFRRLDLGAFGTLIDGNSMATTFGRDLLLSLRENKLDPRSAPELSGQRLEQRQSVWLAGLSVSLDITSRVNFLLDYEYTHESLTAEDEEGAEALVIHGLNARLTLRL